MIYIIYNIYIYIIFVCCYLYYILIYNYILYMIYLSLYIQIQIYRYRQSRFFKVYFRNLHPLWKCFRNNIEIIVKKNAFHACLSSTVLVKKIYFSYHAHVISLGFEHSLCHEPLLPSFLYIPNVWKIGVISFLDIVKICSSPEIPPAFTDKSTLQLSFKVMATVVVMVMMMKILSFIKISIRTKLDLNPI